MLGSRSNFCVDGSRGFGGVAEPVYNPDLLSKPQGCNRMGAAELGPAGPLVLALLLLCQLCSSPEKPTEGKKIPTPEPSTLPTPLNSTISLQLPCSLDDRLGNPLPPSLPLLGESRAVLWQRRHQFPACREGNQGVVTSQLTFSDQPESFLDVCLESAPLAWGDGGTRTPGLADELTHPGTTLAASADGGRSKPQKK